MSHKKGFLTVFLLVAVLSFAFAPPTPLGAQVWPEPNHDAAPSATQLPFFMLLGVFESLAFGFGVAYWVFGRATTRKVFGTGGLATAAHVSIGFLTANFWLHDNLHIINGMDMLGIAIIDYLFHVPLMLAGVILAWAAYKARPGVARPVAKTTATVRPSSV